MKKKIKTFLKRFIDDTIEQDVRIYRLKHTPLCVRRSITKKFLKEYGALPIAPDKVVIDNYMGNGYGCNGKYVTERLLAEQAGLDIVWVVRNVEKMRGEFPDRVRLVKYASKEAFYEYATAAVWLCNYHLVKYFHGGLVKKEGQTYIQMWHGSFGIKKIENDCAILTEMKSWSYLAQKNAVSTDYWISNSGFETAVYRSAFWGAGTVLEYGHPRNDIFFRKDGSRPRQRVEAALGMKSDEKMLFYVPTFRECGESSAGLFPVEEVLKALQEKWGDAYRFVVRFHPRMEADRRKALLEKWKAYAVVDATAYDDIQELLYRADITVTDYSSAIFDFMLTGRPGFLFVPDRASYDEERGFYYPLEKTPFPVAETKESLLEQIREFSMENYQKNIELFLKEKESREDGHAAERVALLIGQICRTNQ